MHLIQGIILGAQPRGQIDRNEKSAENRQQLPAGVSARRLGAMEERIHELAPGNDGDIIAKPETMYSVALKVDLTRQSWVPSESFIGWVEPTGSGELEKLFT